MYTVCSADNRTDTYSPEATVRPVAKVHDRWADQLSRIGNCACELACASKHAEVDWNERSTEDMLNGVLCAVCTLTTRLEDDIHRKADRQRRHRSKLVMAMHHAVHLQGWWRNDELRPWGLTQFSERHSQTRHMKHWRTTASKKRVRTASHSSW